jgi:uncharacterized protein
MIDRPQLKAAVEKAIARSRVVSLLGPRQVGKTTLARLFVPGGSPNYFDLEDPESLARLDEPLTALNPLKGLVVIDEIQKRPELFPVLRVLSDREPLPARFLILGSASPSFIKQSSESLAGRLEAIAVNGFSLPEVGIEALPRHWLRGGFPRSFLAASDEDSAAWRRNFIQTVIERDLPQLGVQAPAPLLLRFWTMLAHYHGKIWNAAEPARSLGVGETTIRRYLDYLTGLYMVRQLQPWHANLKKRQVKSPKIFFYDSGLFHQLMGIRSEHDLLTHPRCGTSWEGYALEETLRALDPDEAWFWATHNEAEIDLILVRKGRRYGVECKHADAPRLTPSIRVALNDLGLEHVWIVYPGEKRYSLAERVTAIPLADLVRSGPSILG